MEMGFKINKAYADNYNKLKDKEELQKLKAKYGNDPESNSSSSSDESEDDDCKGWTEATERDFFRTIAALKSDDPRIKDKSFKFFQESPEEEEEDDDDEEEDGDDDEKEKTAKNKKLKKKKEEKPMYLKDFERKVITEREGKLSDDDDEGNEDDEEKEKPVGYYKEQEEIRKSFKKATEDVDDDCNDEDFLKPKVYTELEKEKRAASYAEYLKGQKEDIDDNLANDLNPLKRFWTDPNLDEKEKFLRDFILNERYKFKEMSYADEAEEEDINADEDQKQFEEEELFATKVNFRFQEEDKEFIKRYPRTIGDSMRNKDSRRSEKRAKVKERKLAEKQKEQEELKRLKNLKKKELLQKINKLKKVTGNETADLAEDELDEDFDPEKHDAVMQKLIGEDYYDQEDDDIHPEFDKEDFDEEYENWDEYTGSADVNAPHGSGEASASCRSGEPRPSTSKKDDHKMEQKEKSSKKKSKFAEELESLKETFDPNKNTAEEYISEVLSRMDYEDKVGDTTFRFNYRNVPSQDYGLTSEEVLMAEEKELNAWVSVKKMSQYRTEEEERLDARQYKKKASDLKKKLNIIPSLREAEKKEEAKQTDSVEQGPSKSQKKRNRKRKNQGDIEGEIKRQRLESSSNEIESQVKTPANESLNTSNKEVSLDKSVETKNKKKKNKNASETYSTDQAQDAKTDTQEKNQNQNAGEKRKKKKKPQSGVPTVSADRLKAYGINEKKFKYVIQPKLHQEMKGDQGQKS